jgi:hypothetical protein
LNIDRSNHSKYLANAEKILIEKKEIRDIILKVPTGRLIVGNFGRGNGQT